MRLILTILLIGLFKADAQVIINASAPYRSLSICGDTSRVLDLYPNAAAAYSLRKLRANYTGSCVRIRRNAVGQTEQDFGFDLCGYLDTNAIRNFLGANSGNLVTWYDQSGNGRNITQTTQSRQPVFFSAGIFATLSGLQDVRKAILFDNTSAHRLINNFSTISQPVTAFSVSRIDNATTGAFDMIYDSYNNTTFALGYTGTTESPNNRWLISSGTALTGTTAGNTNPNLFAALHNGASSSIHINGASYASGNAGTNGLAGISVGNIRGNPNPIVSGYGMDGRIAEIIIYGSNQSSNRTGIESNINTYYGIY